MAFTVSDVDDFLRVLRQNPEWRDAVRREVLGEELLRLPDLVAQNSRDIRDLKDSVIALREAVVEIAGDIRTVNESVASLENRLDRAVQTLSGRIGDVGGWQYEQRWIANAAGRFGNRIAESRIVSERDLSLLRQAWRNAQVTDAEAAAIRALDIIIEGVERSPDGGFDDILLAVEVSTTIERRDIERARERAAILRRVGYKAYPVVAGSLIAPDAQLANSENDVEVFLRPDDLPNWYVPTAS